jgi:hypothetical protein
MKKLLIKASLALACILPMLSYGAGEVTAVYNLSSSGTTSATVFIPPGSEYGNVTDLATRLDSGVTTGQVIFRTGDVQYSSTSATSASGTVVWFSNAGTSVAVGEYIIVYNVTSAQPSGSGTYFVRQVSAATTTSVTVTESIGSALTTSDIVWGVPLSVSRPAGTLNSQTASVGNIWFPKNKPVAVTIDGNTTACRISLSAIRSNYR